MSNLDWIEPGFEPERYELAEWPRPLERVMDRRAFLRRLGGGLLVLLWMGREGAEGQAGQDLPEALPAGRPHAGEREPRALAAWLHVGKDGSVTAYAGKVEVGQNARTSLTLAVAEELRIAPERIKLVLGDTARVPFDRGTYGSLTTPTTFLHLRRAAAEAREVLRKLGAEKLGVEPGALELADGVVQHGASGRSMGYGELTRGEEFVAEIDQDRALRAPADWTVAGKPIKKVDGASIVTGRHRYASDVVRPGMRYGAVLRAPFDGAKLKSVETSAAGAIPGVQVVRDGDFVGVVATDWGTALRTVEAIQAQWTGEKPPGTDQDLHARLKMSARGGKAFAGAVPAADVALERTYTCAYIAHVPLEPRSCVAEWEGDRLTVWAGTQVPFGVRAGLASSFGLPEDHVRVLVPDTGSGYGGKHTPESAIECARLARAAGKPVKLVWTREEEFTWGYLRPAGVVEARAGVSQDGRLAYWKFRNINSGAAGLGTPYDVADAAVEFVPAESPLRQGSYRALASTFNHFARESLMDELAGELGMDRLEFRLRNLKQERLRGVFEAAAERFGWSAWKPSAGRGIGIAGGFDKGSCIATCVEVEADTESGKVRVLRVTAVFEAGAIVNPDGLKNQVEGALIMGLGGALFEQIRYAGGVLRTARLSRYRVPRFGDVPPIEVVLLDRKDVPPAGGGEIPIVAIAPAIAGAIAQATGVRLRGMPLVPNGLKGGS
jgi:isoquinoline 1-oxidoreductase